nr:methyltransferase domain-containing protein [Propionibacterium sp.]
MSRIVAGSRGGQRLVMPGHDRTRPTSDRVRESAFNLIAAWAGTAGEPADVMLDRFSFLDLYAGSGAVALEAASRGAGPVLAVERDAATAAVARRNAERLGLDVRVVTAAVESFVADAEPRAFDVVWLDPPYALGSDAVARVAALVLKRGWLAPDGLVVAERATRDEPPGWPPSLPSTWSRRYGETTLYFAATEAS